jgi:hypothetical protein
MAQLSRLRLVVVDDEVVVAAAPLRAAVAEDPYGDPRTLPHPVLDGILFLTL